MKYKYGHNVLQKTKMQTSLIEIGMQNSITCEKLDSVLESLVLLPGAHCIY